MKIAIVDDIRADAEQLSGYINEYTSIHHIFCEKTELFDSGEAFLAAFSEGSFDIVFMDIYMSGLNGIETARRVRDTDKDISIIFITTAPEFAVDSYEVGASYYILKPVTPERVAFALDRCGIESMERDISVIVPSRNGNVRLFLHRISYTEYVNRHIIVNMKNGSTEEISMNQKELSELLLKYSWFCDCIKGILVNFEDVDKLMNDRFIMKTGVSIPISRLKYQHVREEYLNYSYNKIREEHDT